MNRKDFLLMALIIFFVLSVDSGADRLILKDGGSISGKVISESRDEVKIEINGIEMTYYRDEIEKVEVDPVAKAPQPDVPAPRPDAPDVFNRVITTNPNTANPAALANQPLPSQPVSEQKRALILKFIEVFGTKQSMEQNFQYMMENLPPEQASRAEKILNVDEIIQILIPVYDQSFTEEELNKYIQFYTSAEGKKLIDSIPVLMQKSVQASLQYLQTKFSK